VTLQYQTKKGVAGFMSPVEGVMRLDGREITAPGSDRMMVFQEFDQLPPWKAVRENVMFSPRMAGRNYGLGGIRYVVHILIPAAFPSILAGLEIAWAFAWRTLI